MNRYILSFFVTLLLYTALVASYIYSINNSKIQKTIQPKSTQPIKFTIITQPKQIPNIKIKPKNKPKPKPIIKPKPKPKPTPKLKSYIKPDLLKAIIKKEPIPKKIEKKSTKKTQIKKNNSLIKKVLPTIDLEELKIKQNLFYQKIKTTINKNKYYPKKAIKRGIEGDIKISFILLSSGEVKDIKVMSGKNIFKKSAINSIQKSFPMQIDDKLFKFPKKFNIKLNFKLN